MRKVNTETYGIPLFPRLKTRNVAASSAWYQSLGFLELFHLPAPDGSLLLAHMRWDKYADILLIPAGNEVIENATCGIQIYIGATGETEEVAKRAGASLVEGPVVRPWNTKEVVVRDPNGYELVFTEQANSNLSFEEVMEHTKKVMSK